MKTAHGPRSFSVVLVSRALALACALAACGSGEPPPGPEAPAVTPTTEPPPTSAAPEPPPPTSEGPAAPAEADERPAEPTLAPGGVYTMTQGSIEMMHNSVAMNVVGYPPNVQEAVLTALRGALREALGDFDPDSGDPEYPNTFYGDCNATLVLADLVAYACHLDMSIGRGGGDFANFTATWEITPAGTVRALETDDLLVEGTDLDAVADTADGDPNGPMTVTPTGIGFLDQDGDLAVVPYESLGTLMHRESILSRVPGALDHAGDETPLAQQAAPPESIRLLSEPRPLPAAAMVLARSSETWLFAAQPGTPLDVATPVSVPATPDVLRVVGASTAAAEVAWSTPARVGSATLRRATQLHARPHGPPTGPSFPAGTVVATVLGDLGPGPSRTGAGQWALVVLSDATSGWVPSALLGAEASLAYARVDAFLATLAPDVRAAVAPRVLAVALGTGLVVHAETTPGTTTLGYFAPSVRGEAGSPTLVLAHAGAIADLRRLTTTAAGTEALLLVTWQVPGGTSLAAEVYAMPTSGTTPAAPIVTFSLPLPSAPPRERVTVTTGITRHGTYHPLVVRGPGRTEVAYTWSGTTLVAPPPAAPPP